MYKAKCYDTMLSHNHRGDVIVQATKSNVKLSNILDMSHYMRIAIDEGVDVDENGNYLVNVGYLRVSTDKQVEEGYGLDIQEEKVIKHARDKGLTNLVLFIDDGFTGTKMERPALDGIKDLIDDFNDGNTAIRISSMVVNKMDRLGRTLLGTLQFLQDYLFAKTDSKSAFNRNKYCISFYSVDEPGCSFDKKTPMVTFMLGIFCTLAEFDRDMIVQKLEDGRQKRVAKGKWMGGGNTPYGYRYSKDAETLIVVPEEAEKIRELFRLFIEEKMPPQKIADRLGFKGDKQVRDILKRKSLTGCIIHLDREYPGLHEPIISLERWQEAQDELEKRSVHRAESNYLLSGLLHCGQCRAKMRYQKWNKNCECKLVCYSKQKSKPSLVKTDACDSEYFWASDVEEAVIAELFRMTYLANEEQKKSITYIDPTEALARERKTAAQKLSRLYDLYGSSDGSEDDILAEKIQAAKDRLRQLDAQISSEEEKKKISRKIEKAKAIFRNLESSWPHMTDKEKQSVCQELIDRVVIHKDGFVDVHLKLRSYLIEN